MVALKPALKYGSKRDRHPPVAVSKQWQHSPWRTPRPNP